MPSPTTPDQDSETIPPAPARLAITEPDFSGTPLPIGEFTVRPGFPHCALGAYVDIRGFAGVVVDIVKDSIKVRSPEGLTQRFNANRLKTLYAPPDRSGPIPMSLNSDRPGCRTAPEPAATTHETPTRVYVADPDFTAPVRPINEYAGRPDFPTCAWGKHVDIPGYSGVVVEIVKGSLRVQSLAGTTRSYNSKVLRRLYGKV